jgi:hypothetical protein
VKISKFVFGIVVFFFLFGIYASIIHAEPNVPAPSAPIFTPNQPAGQQPIQNAPIPGSTKTAPQEGKDAPIPVKPADPNQQGFDPTPIPMTPPLPPAPANTPSEAPIKNYQTKWYTNFLFLASMVILLVLILLVIYSLKEGKAPSEEKEETIVSKKKKNSKK